MPLAAGPDTRCLPSHAVVRVVEALSGETEVESLCRARPDYARREPDYSVAGTSVEFDGCTLSGPAPWSIEGGEDATLASRTTLRAGERQAFVLRHAAADEHPSVSVDDPFDALDTTVRFWREWAGRCTYEGPYANAVLRSLLALKLCIDSPTGAIVAAPTTSLPEEIGGERNWDYRFTWIRDTSFTLYALLLTGYRDEALCFFRWIGDTVEVDASGIRVLYPLSPETEVAERTLDHLDGYRGSRPVRIGNGAADQIQLDVYGEALNALDFAVRKCGIDPRPLWPSFRELADWAAANWRQPGSGIWEVRGGVRHFVFGKVMVWVALDRAIGLASDYQLPGDVEHWERERELIRREIYERGWSERLGAFTQSYEDERFDAANLMLPIVGFIPADDARMRSTIDATLAGLVVDGLCYRYLEAPEGVRGREGTFVLCTFWLVDALSLAGRQEEAQRLFEGLLKRATPLGLFAEQFDPSTNAHLGNFPQAFSHLGLIHAAVSLARTGRAGAAREEDVRAATAARDEQRPAQGGGA